MFLNIKQPLPDKAILIKANRDISPVGSVVWNTYDERLVEIKEWREDNLCWVSSGNGDYKINVSFLRHVDFDDATKAKLIEAKIEETEQQLKKLKAELISLRK